MKNWTPENLFAKAFDFWESSTLHAAINLDIFSALSPSSLTVEALAPQINADVRGVRLIVNALVAMNLLEREQEKVKLTDFSRRFLCEDSPQHMRHILLHAMDEAVRFTNLSESVKNGKPLNAIMVDNTPEGLERFLMGMKDKADSQAKLIVPNLNLSTYKTFLDFGGATGAYAIHFCRANPNMKAVVYDLPSTKPFADKVIANENMQERIAFVGGDFFKDEVPTGFDVVWISQILHSYCAEESKALVQKAVRSLNPGGMVLIQEFFMNDDLSGPLFPALFGVNMLLNTDTGATYTRNEAEGWLHAAGIHETSRLNIDIPNACGIVYGIKAN